MTESLLFQADHPVTLRWMGAGGFEVSRRGRLHRVSERAISVMLPGPVTAADFLLLGSSVSAEAGEPDGRFVAVFRGSIASIESRLVRIRMTSEIELVERRRFPRAPTPFRFVTTVYLSDGPERYFLSHPVDIGAGGVRLRHRLPLQPGDRFRLVLRLKRDGAVTPVAEVIESWEEEPGPGRRTMPLTYVSRAAFVDLPEHDQAVIARYVNWILSKRQRKPA